MPSHSSIVTAGTLTLIELAAGQPLAQDVARDDRGRVAGKREIGVLVVLLRDRERWARVDDRLHRRADRARIRDVVPEVGPVVDARRDEIEPVPEVPEEGEADRVGRRAVDRVGQRAIRERPLSYAEWPHQRLLMADRALVRVRGDDRHVTHLVERLLEGEEAARFDPVVVRDEDARTDSSTPAPAGSACAGRAGRRVRRRPRVVRHAPCRGRVARSALAPGSCPAIGTPLS